eukprot:gene21861-42027_t
MTIRYRAESERPSAAAPAPIVATARPATSYDGPVFTLAAEVDRQSPPAVGAPVQPVLPRPAEKTLANGLRVIVARSSDLPLVTADLTVRVGAWADPPGRGGAASTMAGMLTEGTKTRSAQTIASQIESLGASLSAGGGLESSSVTLTVMSDKLKAAMGIMSDVVRNPAFAAEELERQREQALDGLRVAYQQPGQLAGFAAAPVVYAGTPFGHVAQGTPASIRKLKPADLATLHAKGFRPDNAILVLTGDISAEAGFAAAEQAFGAWSRPKSAAPTAPVIRPQAGPRAVAIDIAGTGQASVNVMGPGLARRAR